MITRYVKHHVILGVVLVDVCNNLTIRSIVMLVGLVSVICRNSNSRSMRYVVIGNFVLLFVTDNM